MSRICNETILGEKTLKKKLNIFIPIRQLVTNPSSYILYILYILCEFAILLPPWIIDWCKTDIQQYIHISSQLFLEVQTQNIFVSGKKWGIRWNGASYLAFSPFCKLQNLSQMNKQNILQISDDIFNLISSNTS